MAEIEQTTLSSFADKATELVSEMILRDLHGMAGSSALLVEAWPVEAPEEANAVDSQGVRVQVRVSHHIFEDDWVEYQPSDERGHGNDAD